MHRKKLSLAVAQALGAGIIVGLTAPSAYAQVPAAQAPGTQQAPIERIEKFNVTGSRIPAPNLESTSPITQITAQDIKFEHPVSTENLLNNMPQVLADQGNMLSNGATGAANIDLRGLGSNRTLVLVNGRRLPPGTPQLGGYPADINQIPTQLIQRVEILTGGASAVYGSDAIAGVVNFIMNDRFEGVQFDIGHSFYNHEQHNSVKDLVAARAATNPAQFAVPGNVDSDGEVEDYSAIIGGNFANGKGNATIFLGYHKQQPVLQSQRDFSACSLSSGVHGLACVGSSTSFPGRFLDGNSGKSWTIADAAGNLRPFSAALDQFNFGPYNHYQGPDERWSADAFAHYDAFPWARAYAEFAFHDDHSARAIAPSGSFFGSEFFLSDSNPLLSPAFKTTFGITPTTPGDLILGRRDVEGGPRINDIRNTSYRGVLGVKGTILNGWDYDVYYQQGKVVYSEIYLNDFSQVRLKRALDVVSGPGGVPTCASVINGLDPNCVPWNIFHLGGVTPAAVAYLATPGLQNGTTEQSIVGGTLGADLGIYGWRTPWAKDGIGVSFGAERRVEKINLNTDLEFQTFDLAGQGGPILPTHGQVTVKELFAEVRVPIVEDRPGVQYLAVNGSYRYSDYNTGKTTNTFGLGVEWNPIKEVKLRSSYQRAVRAPNIFELFLPQGLNLFGFTADPCGGGPNGPTATVAQCLLTGLPANLYGSTILTNPAGQGNFLQGGNPNLEPETARSITAGVVWQPMRNFNASLDYFNIKVDKVIVAGVSPTLVLNQCLTSGTFCDLIHRDSRGTLWFSGGGFITATNINLAKLETSGVDVNANYTQPLPGAWGSIGVQFLGTYLQHFKYDANTGLGSFDCAGLYGITCGGNGTNAGVFPTWKHRLRGTWSTPWNVDVSATWRYIDRVKLEETQSDPQLAGAFDPVNAELGTRNYLDLALSWAVTKQVTIWTGVNNVFDRDPPIVNQSVLPLVFGSGNTLPQVYDTLGRRIFVTLTAKF